MRIVIFGADQLIGASILRFLIKLRVSDEIVICSETGELPVGVVQRSNIFKATILNRDDLREIIKEGDIIYNGQVNVSTTDYSNIFSKLQLHNQGLINLLGVANEKKARRIITYMPAFLSWQKPGRTITEETPQYTNDEIHHTFRVARETCINYWNKVPYGYLGKAIINGENDKIVVEDSAVDPSEAPKNTTTGGPSGGPTSGGPSGGSTKPESKKLSLEKELKMKSLSSDPKSSDGQNGEKKAEEGGDDAGIENGSSDNDKTTSELKEIRKNSDELIDEGVQNREDNTVKKIENLGDDKKKGIGKKEEIIDEDDFKTNLILIRGGRIFGPFEEDLTPEIWKGVKIHKLELWGSGKKSMSWIHPEDIAVAMIQASNFHLQGEFMVKSFDISIYDLIRKLDDFNMSRTEIKRKSTLIKRISFFIKTLLNPEVMLVEAELGKYFSTDRGYIIDESKARRKMKWSTQHPLEVTIEESFDWFNNYYLKKR